MNYLSNEMLILGQVGITIIITSSLIFDRVRQAIASKSKGLGELVNCPMCMGFWVGFAFAIYAKSAPPIIMGGIVSFLSWSSYSLVDYISTKTTLIAMKIMDRQVTPSEVEQDEITEEKNEQ
jgi:hypothetical protein